MIDTPTATLLSRVLHQTVRDRVPPTERLAIDLLPGDAFQWGGEGFRVIHVAFANDPHVDSTGPAVTLTWTHRGRTETEVYAWDERFTLA